MTRGIMKKSLFIIIAISIVMSAGPVDVVVNAQGDLGSRKQTYIDYDLLFYDAESIGCTIGVNPSDLIPEAVAKMEAANIQQRAEANKERYLHAERETGVPWQVVAALHYREADMNSSRSISNGQPLGSGRNVDGFIIDADPNVDAAKAAGHFINVAAGVYGLKKDNLQSWNVHNWGEAFLAYNRGYMYSVANEPYTKSPYVMNYYDSQYIDMKWIRADSYFKSKKMNNLVGSTETRPGALAVATYLGFSFATGGSVGGGSANCGGNAGASGDIAATAVSLSWPKRCNQSGAKPGVDCGNTSQPKPEYSQAMKEVGLDTAGCGPSGADCGVFVATVMRKSGVDPEFPTGTMSIATYMRNSSEYVRVIATDTSQLMPGDIFVVNAGSGAGSNGHTMIYVEGGGGDGGGSNASASCSSRTGDRGTNIIFSDSRGAYEIFRRA